ncbi:MAG: D-glycero-beta-D-manno-heptose 1-phosphate adenylyltransferase [Phycisphaerae bacterium]|jgi:D-beta-D-heptose 7-phosphate kinase/D-beta-D-heptose 1-phosphate adenosyltransferase
MKALAQVVERFDQARVLLAGDFMLDRYVIGDADRISPEAPVPVLHVVEREDRVGGAGSVALNVLALGGAVRCIGLLGQDVFGDRVERFLAEAGADCSGLLRVGDRPTITKTRMVGLAEHRHRQQILRVDDEVIRAPGEDDRRALLGAVESAIEQADVVCLEDYAKGVLSPEICQGIIRIAATHRKPVFIDPARTCLWDKYQGATLLTPNWAELEMAVGRRLSADELEAAAAELVARLGFAALAVTLGRDGALLVERSGRRQRFPTAPRAVYDNTGAGDAVLAMMGVATATGATLDESIVLANIAGGLEVSKFGCVPITRTEVLRELREGAQRGPGKVRETTELCAELTTRRHRGETVVFTNGCFDILHTGHVELLEKAKALGSLLVVGLNSDASVRTLGKGPDRPLRSQTDRARLLAALSAVDYVVLFDEPDPGRLIEQIAPDVLVKGADWAGKDVVGREFVEGRGGRVALIDLVEGYSTTAELERIRLAGARA